MNARVSRHLRHIAETLAREPSLLRYMFRTNRTVCYPKHSARRIYKRLKRAYNRKAFRQINAE